jgi:hypothetical protein
VLEINPYGVRRPGGEPGTTKRFDLTAVHREATGTFVGDAALEGPTDVAYTLDKGELRLYAVDGHNRVVRLR